MRKRRFSIYLVVIVAVLGIVGFYFLSRSKLENSEVFKVKVLYAFRCEDGYRFVVVDPNRRSIKLFKAPAKLYDPDTKFILDGSAKDSVIFFEKAFSADFRFSYWIDLKEGLGDFSKEIVGKVESVDSLFKSLLKRGVKLTDIFKVGRMARSFRTFSNLDPEGLYRLLDAFSSYGFEEYEIEGFTKKPIKIEVAGKVYERIYLTENSKREVKETLR